MNILMNNFFIFLTTKTNESMNDHILLALISLIFLFIGCVFLKQGFRAIYCMVKGEFLVDIKTCFLFRKLHKMPGVRFF